MNGWLQLTVDQRRQSLAQAQTRVGNINLTALEKDWWVTVVLQALFNTEYSTYMVFKGGTSLSKGFQLINRFSEDIDIALNSTAFGIEYTSNPNRAYRDDLRRKGCTFTSTLLRDALEKEIHKLGVPTAMIRVTADLIPTDKPDTDPQTLRVHFDSLYDPHPYIKPEVKIEVSVRSMLEPFTTRPILSLLYQNAPNPAYHEEPFNVPIVEPRKTFLEKLFLLHEEFGKKEEARIKSERMSRHMYDLVMIMDQAAGTQALGDHTLYDDLIRHRRSYMNISWVDYDSLGHPTINIVPLSQDVQNRYKQDYSLMQETMFYDETPAFDDLIQQLKLLQVRVRVSREKISWKELIDYAQELAVQMEGETVSVSVFVSGNGELSTQANRESRSYTITFARKKEGLAVESVLLANPPTDNGKDS